MEIEQDFDKNQGARSAWTVRQVDNGFLVKVTVSHPEDSTSNAFKVTHEAVFDSYKTLCTWIKRILDENASNFLGEIDNP